MNIYGWYNWQLKDDSQKFKIQIKNNNTTENLMVIIVSIFLSTFVFMVIINFKKKMRVFLCGVGVNYYRFKFYCHVVNGLEENRTLVLMDYWNIMCIPLFIFKDYTLGVIQFTIFIIIAYQGLKDWKLKLQTI